MRIPVRNIYFMLCYAWESLHHAGQREVAQLQLDNSANLVASVLVQGMRNLMRRGVDRGYLDHTEETPRLRGRIHLMESHATSALDRGRAVCTFDVLSHDVLHNQILSASCRRLLRVKGLDGKVRTNLRQVTDSFPPVSALELSRQHFGRVQLHGNNSEYRFLLNVCKLALDLCVVSEEDGSLIFQEFDRDKGRMRRLFESFVFSYYRHHRSLHGYSVAFQKKLQWWDLAASEFDLRFLPSMNADIVLRKPGRIVVIDTKFSQSTLTAYQGVNRVKSGHLYQITAYMNALQAANPDCDVEGMLLYPTTHAHVSLSYGVGGMTLRAETVDMSAGEGEIGQRLLDLLQLPVRSRVTWLE